MTLRLLRLSLLLLALIGLYGPLPAAAQGDNAFDPDLVQRATVQITQVFTNPLGQTVISCVGSGTLVTADGLILTNAHVVLPISGCRSDRVMVALTVEIGEAPVPKYYAQVVASNIGWDLAVIQITTTLDNRPVDRATLALPFVELGNSEEINLDATIEVAGYAPIDREVSSNTVAQIVRGTVSGFTAESRVGDRAWIKTRALLPGNMTGGGAYNIQGRLIGVPTVEPPTSGIGGAVTENCRRIQDSNGDGRVDERDLCVPTAGLINAIRPSRLARGLILAARLNITPFTQRTETAVSAPAQPPSPSVLPGRPQFTRLLFSPGVDLSGNPTSIITRAPTGISRLYLFFDYANMTDGTIYELRVLRDGVLDPTFSLAPATWSGGPRGLWYIGSSAQIWPNGNYEFVLFIEGVRVATASITVGGPAISEPELANILFGVLDVNLQLTNTGNILPVANIINAEFVYNNMTPDLQWRQAWYYEDLRISESTETWAGAANGKFAINASAPPDRPLQPGRYRLELYVNERLTATSDFVMAGGQVATGAEIFTNLTFASQLTNGRPGGVIGQTFPNTITDLYAIFDWRDIAPGTPFTWRWTVDGGPLFEVTQAWDNASTGSGAWLHLRPAGVLPEGSYRIDLLVAGAVKASATARVGIGQLPVTLFAGGEGVQIQGSVLDAETKEGIPGVAVILLKPEFDVRDFTWQMIEVFDVAYTDSDGRFALAKAVPRDETYSAIIIASGYLPVSTDALEIAEDEKGPVEFTVELNRD